MQSPSRMLLLQDIFLFNNYLSKPSKWCCLHHKWLISFSLCLDALKQLAFYCLPLRVLVILFPFAEWGLCLFVPCMSSFPVDITGLPVHLFYIVFTLSSMNRLKSWEMTKSMNIANWEQMRNSTTVTFTELGALIELLFHVCSHWDVRSKRLIVNGMLWILVALVLLKNIISKPCCKKQLCYK